MNFNPQLLKIIPNSYGNFYYNLMILLIIIHNNIIIFFIVLSCLCIFLFIPTLDDERTWCKVKGGRKFPP